MISGGAVVPLLVGQVADRAGLGWIFVVPLAAYVIIAAFATYAATASRAHVAGGAPNSRLKARLNAASELNPTE